MLKWFKRDYKPKIEESAKPKRTFNADAFQNGATGLGTYSQDKRTAGVATTVQLSREDFEELYRGDDLGGQIVEALPNEMLREGFDVIIGDEPELTEEVNKYLEDMDLAPRLLEALYWSRQHGGAGVLLGVEDGEEDLSVPLDLDKIKSIKFLTALSRWELYPQYYYGDPLAPKYGFPSVYYLQQLFGLPQEVTDPSGQTVSGLYLPQTNNQMALSTIYPKASYQYTNKGIEGASTAGGKIGGTIATQNPLRLMHESRFLLFDGVPVTRVQRVRNSGWGDSVFTRVFEVLRDYQMSWGGVTNLLSDFAQGVLKLQGLNDMLLADSSTAMGRMSQFDFLRSIAKSVTLDAGSADQPAEEFKRETASLAGLPEVLQQLAIRLAAAARMPVSLLMGQSPAGMNATGEADISWYYDRIRSEQRKTLLPQLKKLMAVVFAAKDGPTGGKVPDKWDIQFRALWQLSDLEQAQRRQQIALSDIGYVNAGILTPSEVAISRFGGAEYNPETQLDMDARDKFGIGTDMDMSTKAAGHNVAQGKNPDGSEISADDPEESETPDEDEQSKAPVTDKQ